MAYSSYSADQFLALQSLDQGQDHYVAIHSGGPGLATEGFVIPTYSDHLVNSLGHGEQDSLILLNIVSSYKEEKEGEMKGGKEEEKVEEEEDDQEDVNDILRNVMRAQGIQSVSPIPSEEESPPGMTQRRPLTEKQSHNAVAPSSTVKPLNRKPPIYANLPQGFSYKFGEKGNDCIAGVITGRIIGKGQWFGPYNGSLLNEEAGQVIGSTWELCLRGAVCFYLDGRNKIHNNWLYHINPARTREEQNLEAFQHYGDIYYRAVDTIQPGTELKVFYSDEYRQKIGCKMKLDDLNYQKDTDDFQCQKCKARYKTSKSMLRHIKFSHEQEEGPSKPQLPQDTASSQLSKMDSTASDQLAELAKRVRKEMASQKDPFQRSSGRTASQGRVTKESGIAPKVGTHSKAPVSHGRVQSSRNTHRPEVLLKRATSNISNHSAVTKKKKKSIVLPGGVGSAPGSGDHVCPTCGKIFINEGMLASHQLFHRTTITEFNCEVCGLVCKTYQEFIRHRNGHAERLHNCFLCENKYRYVSSYARHLNNAHHVQSRREKYICRLCKLSVRGKKNMEAHRAICTPEKKDEEEWRREEAEAEKRSNALRSREHGSSHIKGDASVCEELDVNEADQLEDEGSGGWISEKEDPGSDEEGSVNSASGIEGHDRDSMSDSQQRKPAHRLRYAQEESDKLGRPFGYYDKPRPFQCKHKSCCRSYTSRHDLMAHITRIHKHQKPQQGDSRPYKCEQCPRTFSSEQAWNNHKVDHTGIKPYKCEPCFKWFRTSRKLYMHRFRIHKDHVKKHECKICGKKFLEGCALRKHEQRHRGERNFACEICQRTFTAKNSLQNHMVRHTNEKPFACEICGKRFALNLYLVRHSATHHRSNEAVRKYH